MKPYYNIDDQTKHIIFELQKKCVELDLGNVSFWYYENHEKREINFYLTEYKTYWELVVSIGSHDAKRDIYRILDNNLIYQYSEAD